MPRIRICAGRVADANWPPYRSRITGPANSAAGTAAAVTTQQGRTDQAPGVPGGGLSGAGRQAWVGDPGQGGAGEPQQLGVLGGDGVRPEGGGPDDGIEDREVEPQVEQRDHATDLAAESVPDDVARHAGVGPAPERAAEGPGVPPQPVGDPDPGRQPDGQVGDQQADDHGDGTVETRREGHQVERQEPDLLGRDDGVAAPLVLEPLQRGLPEGQEELRRHREPGQDHHQRG